MRGRRPEPGPYGVNLNGTSTAARVLDFLETHDGSWYSIENLADWIPDVTPRTLRRAVYRLQAFDLLQSRTVRVNGGHPPDYPPDYRGRVGTRPVTEWRVPDRRFLDEVWG